MLKAAKKKLKFWSKTKKPKKNTNSYHFHPPSPCHCCTFSCSSAVQPSAPPRPPLPPWINDRNWTFPSSAPSPPGAEEGGEVAAPPLYQQYMAPNPVYGVPMVVKNSGRREKWLTVTGCGGDWGIRLIQCFCPCFRIRVQEAIWFSIPLSVSGFFILPFPFHCSNFLDHNLTSLDIFQFHHKSACYILLD